VGKSIKYTVMGKLKQFGGMKMNNPQLVLFLHKKGLPMQLFFEIVNFWFEWIFQKELIEQQLERFMK